MAFYHRKMWKDNTTFFG